MATALYGKENPYEGEAEISSELIDAKGIEIPTRVYENAREAICLEKFPEEVRPFIEDIFINKYPNCVSLHSLDAGDLSKTLGFVKLRLREGETLPRSKRIFYISPSDVRHLEDICELLIKYNYLIRSPLDPNGAHLYGMAAYLVPRAKEGSMGRLVVDYSPINQLIESPANVIPEIQAQIQFLQGKAMFSGLDLRYAFLALKIDPASQPLTTFLTPTGSYQWVSLPTGAACSPTHFSHSCNKMLHYKPVRDENGEVILEEPNKVKLERDPLPHSTNFFDDIIIASKLCSTYENTLKQHFCDLEQVISRMAFHGAKINVNKCDFAKTKIQFLGWFVCNDYIVADPRRVKKVKEFQFPTNKKGMRAFLGLVNSLRRVLHKSVIEQISILTPLTSSKAVFSPEPHHFDAFEKIKVMLVSEPLFSNLIDERAEKILWVDAATSTGVLGAVLAQKCTDAMQGDYVPPELDLSDPVHRIIYDKKLKYTPVQLHTTLPFELPKPSSRKTRPPKIDENEPLLGFTPENVQNSFFLSVISTLAVYGCKVPETTLELRKAACKKLRQTVLNNKLKDFCFNLNYNKYKAFLDDFLAEKVGLDPDFYLAEALAIVLYRPVIIISSLKRHSGEKIISFNAESTKPPLVLGLYEKDGHEIFLPFIHNKNTEFKLENLKTRIEIVAYSAKTIPEAFKSRPILDLEVYALLNALYGFHRLISGVPVKLLTDSRVLYYLFSSRIGNSSVKIRRWCLKVLSDYPNLELHFVKSNENLADFLTREGMPEGDLEKLDLKTIKIENFYDKLPKKTFSLPEWMVFVEDNPQYLSGLIVNKSDEKVIVNALSRGIENVKETVSPLDVLREKLTREKIVTAQKEQLPEIYQKCLSSENFEFRETHVDNPKTYKILDGLLMVKEQFFKIYVPPSLVGPLLANYHLAGHKGVTRMMLELQNFFFPNMYTVTKLFVQSCYSCFLSTKSSKKEKLGIYPVPSRPMEEIYLDILENINPIKGYSHLLIILCSLSDFIVIVPLRTKKNSEISKVLINSVLQQFNVKRIHSDNGPGFRDSKWLQEMAALKIEIIHSSSLHPAGRGQIERMVRTVKEMMKKLLATRRDLNWEYIPFIVAKILNNSITPKTGFKPSEMLFGKDGSGSSFLELETLCLPHHLVKNNKQLIEQKSEEIANMTKLATEKLQELRFAQNEKKNKNRIEKDFPEGSYVFTEHHTNVAGASRPLKTRLNPSPFVVVRQYFSTVLLRRLSDGFLTMYHKDSIKKYDKTSPLFSGLPKEVHRVLLYKFADLLEADLKTLIAVDTLELPESIQLFEENEPLVTENENDPVPGPSGIQNTPLNATESEQGSLDVNNDEQESLDVNIDEQIQRDIDSDSEDEDDEGITLRSGKRVTFQD
jgi:hypothetical protein